MKNLAYHKFNYLMPLYLEYAPLNISRDMKKLPKQTEAEESTTPVNDGNDEQRKQERTVFVKNLNFSTTEEMLEQIFKEVQEGAKALSMVSCKIVRNSKTQLSRGYGFVEFETREEAEKAMKKFQNFLLEDHALKLSIAAGKKSNGNVE